MEFVSDHNGIALTLFTIKRFQFELSTHRLERSVYTSKGQELFGSKVAILSISCFTLFDVAGAGDMQH
jgi:hypothetical protein